MAQQYRELGSSGAASRQVAKLNQGQFTPDESTSNLANFAKDLGNFGGDLSGYLKRKEAKKEREQGIQDDIDQKRADEEQTRLRIEAQRKLISSGGENWETAHGAEGVKAGEAPIGGKDVRTGKRIKNKSNADVVNPVYKKEYELAYTKRKVDKFQNSLNNRADAEVKEMYSVWEKGFEKGGKWEGVPFEKFASLALTNRKDDWYKNELSMLPHFGEFAEKINYAAHEKKIAELDQGFRDKQKSKFLGDAVTDHLEEIQNQAARRSGLPETTLIKEKTTSAAADLLSKVESLRGKQQTEDGQIRGIYTKKEVHGAFIKNFNDKLTLCDSVNCPIFRSMNEIFDSPDAHILLKLDPNSPDGIGKQYEDLKSKAEARYVILSNKQESTNTATSKKLKEDATKIINGAYSRSSSLKLSAARGELDLDELERLEDIIKDTGSYSGGNLDFLDDTRDILIGLRNPDIKGKTTPLTDKEKPLVTKFITEELKSIDDLKKLSDLRLATLHGEEPARVAMAKIKAMDTHKKALEDAEAAKKIQRDETKFNSANSLSSFQMGYTNAGQAIRNTERSKDGKRSGAVKEFTDPKEIEKKRNAIKNSLMRDEDKLTALASLDAEVLSVTEEENAYQDGQQTNSFFDYVQNPDKFNSEKITKKNITELSKKISKINDPALRKTLNTKLTEITKEGHSQDALVQAGKDLKTSNKAYDILAGELNAIKVMDSKVGIDALTLLKKRYEEDKKFLLQASVDPAKRNFLDEISKTESYLQKKIPEEQKEADLKIARDAIKISEESKLNLQNSASKLILAFEEKPSDKGYATAMTAIMQKIDMAQLYGKPINENIYPEDRRLSLIDRLNDSKAKGSGQVPSLKEFDPKVFTKYEDKISILDGKEGQTLKDAIKEIRTELRGQYHAFEVPQQIYEDFVAVLDATLPDSPKTLSPIVSGRTTIRSAFLGKMDKFDNSVEFQVLGGKEPHALYDMVRKVYERKITAATQSPDWDKLSAVEKLDRADTIASDLLDKDKTKEEGGMDKGWRGRYEIYISKWEKAEELSRQQKEAEAAVIIKESKKTSATGEDGESLTTTTGKKQLIDWEFKVPFVEQPLIRVYKGNVMEIATTKATKYKTTN